jgi:hypothetical protein
MIYLDSQNYAVDQTLDGGDSAVRAGIFMIGNKKPITGYVNNFGEGVRHPNQYPWNNPKNFSRDQLVMLLAGLYSSGQTEAAKKVFWSHGKRLWLFAQNTERDVPGSTKYPWPHNVDGKLRVFDSADPIFPNHIGMMILASKSYWAYPFLPVAYLFHIVFMLLHSFGNHYEENQAIAESHVYGTLGLLKKLKPNWKKVNTEYWQSRNEIEYQQILEKLLDK